MKKLAANEEPPAPAMNPPETPGTDATQPAATASNDTASSIVTEQLGIDHAQFIGVHPMNVTSSEFVRELRDEDDRV